MEFIVDPRQEPLYPKWDYFVVVTTPWGMTEDSITERFPDYETAYHAFEAAVSGKHDVWPFVTKNVFLRGIYAGDTHILEKAFL